MKLGRKLREIRAAKKLTQADLQASTGIRTVHISRMENDHISPSIETLEKYARGLGIPVYRFFYDGKQPPKKADLSARESRELLWGSRGKERRELGRFIEAVSRMDDRKRKLLLAAARFLAWRSGGMQSRPR
jgi:transcriptional regulator with XRE-family HTH domain